MPTYQNTGSVELNVGTYRFSPGEIKAVNEYLVNLPSGLVKTLDTPYIGNPVLYSADVSNNTPVAVPVGLQEYTIKMYCKTAASVLFNSTNNTPAKVMYAGEIWVKSFKTRAVDSIIVSSGEVYISIETQP